MKGISPLVASVLLIAITMAVAAVIANFVSSQAATTLSGLQTGCIGGSISFVTADYPKWDDPNNRITAAIQANNVDLSDFTFDVIFVNDSTDMFSDTTGLSLSSGSIGTAISQTIGGSKSDIKQVRISSNCSTVKTEWTTLR